MQDLAILKLFDQSVTDRETLAIPIGARAPKNTQDAIYHLRGIDF